MKMLILTDRSKDLPAIHGYLARGERGDIVDLRRAKSPVAEPAIIVCDADIASDGALRDVKAALSGCGAGVPLLLLTRDNSQGTLAAARALGAAETLRCTAAPALILAAAQRLSDAHLSRRKAGKRRAGETDARAGEVKALLARCFDSVNRRKPISVEELDKGASVVLSAIRKDKIRVWLDIVRQFDDVTYQHCLLVAGLVAALAVKLNLTPKHQRLLSQAAIIHDVGKARVPANILTKAAPLTKAEMEIMRTHSALGYEMLAGQPGLDPVVLDVVRHHHEYLDGSGYPDGLKGPQISGYARITTICDIYAALIERRPYKAPLPPQRALAVLTDDFAGKLDVDLLTSFKAVVADSE